MNPLCSINSIQYNIFVKHVWLKLNELTGNVLEKIDEPYTSLETVVVVILLVNSTFVTILAIIGSVVSMQLLSSSIISNKGL